MVVKSVRQYENIVASTPHLQGFQITEMCQLVVLLLHHLTILASFFPPERNRKASSSCINYGARSYNPKQRISNQDEKPPFDSTLIWRYFSGSRTDSSRKCPRSTELPCNSEYYLPNYSGRRTALWTTFVRELHRYQYRNQT